MTIEEIRKLKEKADAGDAIACINYSKAVFDRREEKPQFYFSRCWTAIRYLSKADEFGHFDEETRRKNVRNAARVMEMLINRNYGENIKTSDMVKKGFICRRFQRYKRPFRRRWTIFDKRSAIIV